MGVLDGEMKQRNPQVRGLKVLIQPDGNTTSIRETKKSSSKRIER